MQVVMKSLGEIHPYSKNAKKHDEKQIKNVAESIKQYGFVQPVVVDKNNVIVIGHCRALAAKKLGIKDVPCLICLLAVGRRLLRVSKTVGMRMQWSSTQDTAM